MTAKTTEDRIYPILADTYGKGSMVSALAAHLSERIDAWPAENPYRSENRETMIMRTCWDWFGGGNTAASVAHEIEEALR